MTTGLRHEAAFYAGEQGFLECTVPFVAAAVEAGEPVMVMVGPDKLAAIRDELGRDADRVQFADMREVGANPAWIIPAWQEFVDARARPGVRLRGIGEPIWRGRSDAELVECQRHERLIDFAFAAAPPFWLLCPYDTRTLDPQVVATARADHSGASGSAHRERAAEHLAGPALPAAPAGAERLEFDECSLRSARSLVGERARAAGLDARETAELVLSVHELATNSVRHGGGSGTLLVWRDGPVLVCEVRDAGRITDPLAGRVRPPVESHRRRGLWLAHRLCGLVQLRSDTSGTAVRLHFTPASEPGARAGEPSR